MITNKAIQKKPEHKQVMQFQSWYEPALRTLDGLLEIRRVNLRKVKGDEKNAGSSRMQGRGYNRFSHEYYRQPSSMRAGRRTAS